MTRKTKLLWSACRLRTARLQKSSCFICAGVSIHVSSSNPNTDSGQQMQCMSLWHMFGGQIYVIFWRAIDLLHIFQVTPCRLLCEVTCYIAGFNFYAFRVAEVVSTCCICRSGVKKCVMHCFWFVIHVLLVCCQIAMHVAFQEWHYTVSNLLCVTCCKSGFLQFTTCSACNVPCAAGVLSAC